ncbi:DUF4132 domain-containing protein [Mucilaginibacter pedocola]|uniref:Uncharacterized protein n=1 Tax=Mucilaginibacter pedocola TaxID=1792845 RepID=A0A1S9P9Q7_9SPHI|nr:DUF4132 domain-containing protein [Mucilaginibacter pedocola]OOQ57318.1 hypothetical protein BC343_14485 [Mucilaginibacter pedocola]
MGIFDKILGVFQKEKKEPDSAEAHIDTSPGALANWEFSRVITNTRTELEKIHPNYFYDLKISACTEYTGNVVAWGDKKKIQFILYCVERIIRFKDKRNYNYRSDAYKDYMVQSAYLGQLFRTKLHIDAGALEQLVDAFTMRAGKNWGYHYQWPINPLLNQLSRLYGKDGLPAPMHTALYKLKQTIFQDTSHGFEKDKLKLMEKIDQLIFKASAAPEEVKPTLFLGKDPFSDYANPIIEGKPAADKQNWYKLITKAGKATGSKPSAKFLAESKELFTQLGTDKFKAVVNDWFLFVIALKEETTETTQIYGGQVYTYYNSTFLSSINVEAIKGFVWMCANFHDNATLNNLAKLAERSFRKIPGQGPAAAAVGNACLYALYRSKGLDGIGHLSRLKLRVKQASTQQLIEKYIAEAATAQGVSTHVIEDMAVDDLKLVNGSREWVLDDFTCKLTITGLGKSELSWFKAYGSQQKSVPAAVKDKYAEKLKKIKDTQKQTDQGTAAQRDRIDRMFRTGRSWSMGAFNQYYLEHGLISFLAKRIIWNFTTAGETISAMQLDGGWRTSAGEIVTPAEDVVVSLWHPALATLADVKAWRAYLMEHQIQQPLKQAFREVYLLTEAELNTRTYSNRMAAHVLKQHQFNMLAKVRGWKYALMGAFDNGMDNGTAEVNLPEYGLKAQYWVNEVNADDAFNTTGIWNYVTTDQVRFVNSTSGAVVELIEVPPLALSEVLRDVDLFVGVASVGNDPNWQDSGGLPALNTYWQSYSFGDLTEVAKTRKEILTGLLPRLKISKVAEIRDKFVVVKGKLRTYKIHIGSTNILMEPNDQYLCIVPDRSQKSQTENVFLPFEGDAGLSVIISKAFLLADDDKITDRTITSQINRK